MLIMDNRGKSWLIGQVQSENPVLRSCFGSGFGSGVARQELPRLFELTDMGLTRMEFKEPPLFEKSRGTWRTMRKPRQRMDNQFIRDSDRVCFSPSTDSNWHFWCEVWYIIEVTDLAFSFPFSFSWGRCAEDPLVDGESRATWRCRLGGAPEGRVGGAHQIRPDQQGLEVLWIGCGWVDWLSDHHHVLALLSCNH